jgi:hypothetical protein
MMRKRAFLMIFLAFLLASCGSGNDGDAGVYLPPTPPGSQPGSTVILPTQVISIGPQPTPEVVCANNLFYLDDLTIPDGSVFPPGAAIDKQWLVENNGDCSWDSRYRLELVSGVAMGVPEEQALYPARAGSQAVIRINFIAPNEPGNYRSEWQAYDPQGVPFGDPIFIEIVVSP